MKQKVKAKNIIALFVLLIPIWLIGMSNFLFSSASFMHEVSFDDSNAINVFPYGVIEVIGYEQVGNTFLATYHDPQIHIEPPGGITSSVRVVLENPVNNPHSMRVYYCINHEGFGPAREVVSFWQEGSSEMIISLPPANLTGLRLDIDIYGEIFEIRGIYLSESAASINRQWVGNYDGILMTLILTAIVLAIWSIGLFAGNQDKFITRFTDGIIKWVRIIKENPKKTLLNLGILFAIPIIALAIGVIFSGNVSVLSTAGIIRVFFYAIVGFSMYCIVTFRGKPEKLFLSLSLLIGVLYIAVSPFYWWGWDQRSHFAWSFEDSFVRTVSVSHADWYLANALERNWWWPIFPGRGAATGFGGITNLLFSTDNPTLYSFTHDTFSHAEYESGVRNIFARFAHRWTGLFIFIGRSLSLTPVLIVKLGIIGNHLIYTLIVYFAIKRLNSGKYIMATIAMLPTAFVLSTTYGYDHWLIALTMLGFAYFFYEVQSPEKEIELKSIIIIIGAFFLGIGPKAIYFPLMMTLLLLSKDKFRTTNGYKGYMLSVAIAAFALIASFAVPFIATDGGGEGDWRGGYYVNSSAQTMFILNNPITYAGTLLRFLPGYIFEAPNYILAFGAYGTVSNMFLVISVLALMLFTVMTDRMDSDAITATAKYRIITAVAVLSTIALFSTALYIMFTSVGVDYIAGVQGRYMIPVLFPILYVVACFRIKNNINKSVYSSLVFGIMSFVLLFAAWEVFILPR